MKITTIKIKTRYWPPGTDYIREILDAVREILLDGDIVTVSEKAVSTAMGTIIDESRIKPGIFAQFLVTFWMSKLWGGPLGRLTKLRERT